MTRNESFKRRIRARMAKTGERYGAARRVLIERAGTGSTAWAARPETSDEAVTEETGRSWDEWRHILDGFAGDQSDHGAMVAFVENEHGVDPWWAQTVVVGYERISGRRLPHQMADGTFTANKSGTVPVDGSVLRSMLLDPDDRDSLFGGLDTSLRSRPSSKVLRLGVGDGVALVSIEPTDDARCRVVIQHEKLPHADDVEHWKAFWTDWLEALAEAVD